MRRRTLALLPALVAAAAGVAAPAQPAPAAAATLAMSGSSTALPVVADLAYFYRRGHRRAPRFSLTGGGTDAGVIDVARGITDAGLASRAPRPDDPPGLVHTPFALSGVCLATNRANHLPDMSRALLQDLVAGRVTRWSQVPGAGRDAAIVAVGLTPGRGARSVFTSTFLDAATPVAYAPRTVGSASQTRAFLLGEPDAWGYVDLLYTRGLHVVPYEGIPCTRSTILAQRYPATRPLSFVTRGRPRGAAGRFVRWVRASRVARRVIATRYVPVPSE